MIANKNRRVLVVDDNPSIHDDFRKILSPASRTTAVLDEAEKALFGCPTDAARQTKFEVDSAFQGQEGLLLVKKAIEARRPYAMAFVDVRMPPGWDGVETIRKIWEVDPDLQIVLCTAYSDYSWDEMFEQLGQRDGLLILKKPFDTVEAFQMAHALTEKWGLLQQSRRKMNELESSVAARTRELQQTNDALQKEVGERERAQSFLNSVVENLPMAVFIKEAKELRFVLWNKAGEKLTGIPNAEMMGKTDHDFFPSQEAELYVANDRAAFEKQGVLEIPEEVIHTRGHGAKIIRTWKVPIFDPMGQPAFLLGISEDITARKRIEAQLFQSQKMETVGKLAGGIAHEFNSILTVIMGQCELILGTLPDGHPLSQNAVEISKAAGRAATLTRQLLAYGRRTFLRPETLDLNQIIASMENTIRHLMGRAVEVRILPAEGLYAVKADAGQIEQVILNLIMNASDAMPEGGILTLETGNVSFDQQSVGRSPELKPGDYARLAITDTGAGMSEAVKDRAFEPFFTTKDVGQGVGLGLSTGYGIIKQSSGHISVSSEPGRGATFHIYLPQVEPRAIIPIEQLDSPDLPRGTETILLAESDPALREMAATLLGGLGYTVFAAANGLEALSLKQQSNTSHIHLLFADLNMPLMNGKELAQRVLALSPRTRILFTSSYVENTLLNPGGWHQHVALLQKPFSPSALARKIREVLHPSGSA
jgi:two-component system, cell cycle sensor histidine kinase and response regulator CckA